jgi:hypothetical protein
MLTAVRRYTGQGLKPFMVPELAKPDAVRLMPGTYAQGQCLGQFSNWAAGNDVQTLTVTGTPTGGNFYLNFNGDIIGPVPFNATSGQIQTLVNAAPQMGLIGTTPQVVVTGGPLPGTAIVFTFSGANVANLNQPLITVQSNALTGGATPAAAVAHTTVGSMAGGAFGKYADANTDGTGVFKAILMMNTVVNTYGEIRGGGGQWGEKSYSAPVWIAGYFRPVDLVGFDAAALVDVGGTYVYGDSTKLANAGTVIRIP